MTLEAETEDDSSFMRRKDFRVLKELGCRIDVCGQITRGITYAGTSSCYVYVAGRMRGIPNSNFPAFDSARDHFVNELGYNVISPADIDRAADGHGIVQTDEQATADAWKYAYRDTMAIMFLAKQGNERNSVAFLPDFERSVGAFAELGLARWLGLELLDQQGDPLHHLSVLGLAESLHKSGLSLVQAASAVTLSPKIQY